MLFARPTNYGSLHLRRLLSQWHIVLFVQYSLTLTNVYMSKYCTEVQALKDVSFELNQGDSLGYRWFEW